MKLLNYVVSVLISMVLFILFFSLGPDMESRFFPVYSHFEIVKAENTPDGVRVTFAYTKYRNCQPMGYAWYDGELGEGETQLNVKRSWGRDPRPPGVYTTVPLEIPGITVLDLTEKVAATLYARCHPLWLSESHVRP